jgi:hypothetical protein
MTRKVLLGGALLTLVTAAPLQAQTITKWTLRVYNVGAPSPLSAPTDFIIGTNLTCGVDPTTITVSGTNPMKAVFDDPAQAGKACVYTDPGTGPLLSTPFGGTFEATLTATNSAGTSPESAPRVPFSHPGLTPPAPGGLRFGR